MSIYLRNKRGFSIIEFVVYAAVLALLMGVLVTTFLSLNMVIVRNTAERTLTNTASVSLERIVRAARSADGINSGASTFGTSYGSLRLTEGATTTQFYVANGKMVMAVNGIELGPLTSGNVTVQDVVFRQYTSSTTDMIRVALTLSIQNEAASSTRTFYSSAVLRGLYE